MPEVCLTLKEMIDERVQELRVEMTTLSHQLCEARDTAAAKESRLTKVQQQIDRLVSAYTYERQEEVQQQIDRLVSAYTYERQEEESR